MSARMQCLLWIVTAMSLALDTSAPAWAIDLFEVMAGIAAILTSILLGAELRHE